jgi:hypothetical protein
MADYATRQQAINRLGGSGQWTNNAALNAVMDDFTTALSRRFDRETGRPTNFWAPGTGITRRYSGSGMQLLDIDEYDLITAVIMTSNQARSDVQTLTVSDATSPNYVEILPLQGPPYAQLFLLRGWLQDVYQVGNVAVTGNVSTPADITDAVAIWAAYKFKRREAGWADTSNRPDNQAQPYGKDMPEDVAAVIEYYKEQRGPKLAMVGGGGERTSMWLDWQTYTP